MAPESLGLLARLDMALQETAKLLDPVRRPWAEYLLRGASVLLWLSSWRARLGEFTVETRLPSKRESTKPRDHRDACSNSDHHANNVLPSRRRHYERPNLLDKAETCDCCWYRKCHCDQ